MMYSDGRIYQGDMHQDKRHGRGKMTLPNGEYYEGEWKMGRKHGKGYYHFPNGDTYDGDYENDIKQGHGVFRWANGDTYEGGIKNGLKHGKGILRFVVCTGCMRVCALPVHRALCWSRHVRVCAGNMPCTITPEDQNETCLVTSITLIT